ncbi:MAG: glycosyltransferase [Sediminibacterium sp.]|jgi:cellulose synthase/poly-beta-1,6-N-acetylglucosamine synthase-like glycosyltransferase
MGLNLFQNSWVFIQLLVGYNLVFPLLLLLLYSLLNKKVVGVNDAQGDYAIIITAYQQTHTLQAVVDSVLQLKYTNYLVYIVADNCDTSELNFNEERVVLLRPNKVLASNTRSHFYAIENFKRPHNRLTIIDSDNILSADYLDELNVFFNAGFSAVQGVRNPKNLNNTLACLDAARDIYYHFYDGLLLFGVGSSATLAGSGMAFTTELYITCLAQLSIEGAGFDKVLQNEIVSRGFRIAYAPNAEVLDEKTANSDQLVKQRARWINTWFRYFKFGFGMIYKGLVKFNWNKFMFGWVLLRPPLFIFLALSFGCFIIDVLIFPTQILYWVLAFVLFVVGFILSLLLSKTNKLIYRSLWGIPYFIFHQLLSLLKVSKANELSIATKHSVQDKNKSHAY